MMTVGPGLDTLRKNVKITEWTPGTYVIPAYPMGRSNVTSVMVGVEFENVEAAEAFIEELTRA